MKYVSFPGLGLEQPIKLNPVAFTVFNIDVMWYGVIITCGMLLAYIYGLTRAKIEKVKSEDITDLTLFLVIFGVIGARLYYIIFKLDEFIVRTEEGALDFGATLKAMVNLRNGGLAIYGGIIAGFVTAIVVARIKRIRFPVLADIVAPCLFIGQSIGRWGNFMNVEAFGRETTLPWRMGVGVYGGAPFVHPTFLYESLWNLVGFILIAVFYKKKKFHGQVFLFYGIWYGIGRAWIEGLRTDSLMLGPIRVSQLLSILIVIGFSVLMALGMKKALAAPAEGVFGDVDGENEDSVSDGSEDAEEKADEGETEAGETQAESDEAKSGTEESEDGTDETEADEESPALSVYGEAPSESDGSFEPTDEDGADEEAPEDDASDDEAADDETDSPDGSEAEDDTDDEDGKDN